jgi:predicted dehydrogenase
MQVQAFFSSLLVNVRSQYHMKLTGDPLKATWLNPRRSSPEKADVGIIGCGNFSYSTVAHYCNVWRRGSIRAVYDPVGLRAVSLCRQYGGVYAASAAEEIMDDQQINTVFIVSNHASHADYAALGLEKGKSVHVEKPHVVNEVQLQRLIRTVETTGNNKLFVGFNRPRSKHFAAIKRELDKQSGPMMINWFIAGHELDEAHWYFSEHEGGRVLGNLCHWTDLTLRLIGIEQALPISVVSGSVVESKSDFALTFTFGDGSVASITFSAKGHTFEGVREYLSVHKGNALISMRDFHETTIDVGQRRSTFRTIFRDHGHKSNIYNSLDGRNYEPMNMVTISAELFRAAKRAIATREVIVVR